MIIAGYTFGVDYPFIDLPHDDRHPISQALGWFLYESYYGVMFPGRRCRPIRPGTGTAWSPTR